VTPSSTAPTNVDIVVFALASLEGAERSVHLEEIAVEAHRLSPGAFRWDLEEYAEMIDKDKVRVSLTDAQKDKYRNLVRAVGPKRQGLSKPTDVWRLTPAGVEWHMENAAFLSEEFGEQQPALKKGRARRVRDRILDSDLYKEFEKIGRVEYQPFLFADLVESSPDADESVIQKRYDELLGQVVLLKEADLKRFLEDAASAHADMLINRGDS
jgi:hypothetical protein